jgi:hypothetical protein
MQCIRKYSFFESNYARIIDMKKCSKCKEIKKENEFSFKIKKNAVLQSQCKTCMRASIKSHYEKNKDYYLKKTAVRNLKLRNEANEYLNKYLGCHPCVDCGESDITVLEFDHKDRKNKYKEISSLVRNRFTLDVIKNEVKKCEIRCANCHRRKTALQFNWSKNNKRS